MQWDDLPYATACHQPNPNSRYVPALERCPGTLPILWSLRQPCGDDGHEPMEVPQWGCTQFRLRMPLAGLTIPGSCIVVVPSLCPRPTGQFSQIMYICTYIQVQAWCIVGYPVVIRTTRTELKANHLSDMLGSFTGSNTPKTLRCGLSTLYRGRDGE